MLKRFKKSEIFALNFSIALIGLNSFANEIGSPVNDQGCGANSRVESIGFLNGVNFRILKAENLITTTRERDGTAFSPLLLANGCGTLKELHRSVDDIRADLIAISNSVSLRKHHPNDLAAPKTDAQLAAEIGASADQLGQLNEKMEEFCEEYEFRLEQHSVQKEFDELGHEFIDRLRKAYHWIYLTLKLPRPSRNAECNSSGESQSKNGDGSGPADPAARVNSKARWSQ